MEVWAARRMSVDQSHTQSYRFNDDDVADGGGGGGGDGGGGGHSGDDDNNVNNIDGF